MTTKTKTTTTPTTPELVIGHFYLVRGGHVLRYQGRWQRAKPRPCDAGHPAFRDPRDSVEDPPTGVSIAAEDVLQEITVADVPWLTERAAQARVRGLSDVAAAVDFVIHELTGGAR